MSWTYNGFLTDLKVIPPERLAPANVSQPGNIISLVVKSVDVGEKSKFPPERG